MKGSLTFGVETTNLQKLTALRDRCADWLNEDPEVKVFNQAMSPMDREFTVVGVIRGKPDQRWEATVMAQTSEEAEAKAVAEDKQRTVAKVL